VGCPLPTEPEHALMTDLSSDKTSMLALKSAHW